MGAGAGSASSRHSASSAAAVFLDLRLGAGAGSAADLLSCPKVVGSSGSTFLLVFLSVSFPPGASLSSTLRLFFFGPFLVLLPLPAATWASVKPTVSYPRAAADGRPLAVDCSCSVSSRSAASSRKLMPLVSMPRAASEVFISLVDGSGSTGSGALAACFFLRPLFFGGHCTAAETKPSSSMQGGLVKLSFLSDASCNKHTTHI